MNNQLRFYPVPTGEMACDAYTVTVEGTPVFVHGARVSAQPFNRRWPGHQRPLDQTEIAGFVSFEATGAVTVRVRPPRPVTEAVVRPLARGVTPQADSDGTLCFTLPGPGAYTLEPYGRHEALHLFVDPPAAEMPDPADPNVLYYGPGLHEAGVITLKSGQTLFLDEGAVVFGRIEATDADHIRILGRGILDNSHNEGVFHEIDEAVRQEALKNWFAVPNVTRIDTVKLNFCDDVTIDGITIRDSLVYNIRPIGCRDLTISHVKLIGNWRYNSDGIDMHNCRRVHIADCFIRTFDDSLCLKGFDAWQNEADMDHDGERHDVFDDVLVERCVVWCDWGNALEFGAETRAREIAHVTFRDCDVIHACGAALDVQNVDYAEIHDVLFEDIRVEYEDVTPEPQYQASEDQVYRDDPHTAFMPRLLCATIAYIPEYSTVGRRGRTRALTFRRIYVTAPIMPPSVFFGYDEEHRVQDVRIEELYRNGRRVTALEDANVTANEFVRDITLS